MTEIFVVRNGNRYDLVKEGNNIGYGLRTGGFLDEKVTFYMHDSSLAATYIEKRNPFSKKRRTLYMSSKESEFNIRKKAASYNLQIEGKNLGLKYGLLKFQGFYFDEIMVGGVELISSKAIEYKKKISFEDNFVEYLIAIYLYISVDYFDVN